MGKGCTGAEAGTMTINTPSPPGSIVVGVDGSPGADLAVDSAARTAAIEHRPLVIVHSAHVSTVVGDGVFAGTAAVDVFSLATALKAAGRDILAGAVARAKLAAPDVEVEQFLSTQDPRSELIAQALHAHLVVIGSRGRGSVASLMLGSVSITV